MRRLVTYYRDAQQNATRRAEKEKLLTRFSSAVDASGCMENIGNGLGRLKRRRAVGRDCILIERGTRGLIVHGLLSLSPPAVMVDWGLFPRYRPSLTLSSSTNFSSLRVEEGGDGPKLFRIRGAVTWLTGRLRSRYLLLQEREQREFFFPFAFPSHPEGEKERKGNKKKTSWLLGSFRFGFPPFFLLLLRECVSYPGNPADPSSLSFLSPFPLFAYCWYVSLMCSVRVYSARPQAAVTTQAENFSFWLLPFLLSDYLMPLLFIYIYIYIKHVGLHVSYSHFQKEEGRGEGPRPESSLSDARSPRFPLCVCSLFVHVCAVRFRAHKSSVNGSTALLWQQQQNTKRKMK